MSHSFDSTLLQRMGFRDPDRGMPEHDRACIEVATKPLVLLGTLNAEAPLSIRAHLEVPLQKGDGKYATTVGFIDAVVTWQSQHADVCCDSYRHERGGTWVRCDRCKDYTRTDAHALVLEVKSNLDSIGDLLRQMNLYREYKRDHQHARVEQFVVWSLRADDRAFGPLLASQGYRLVVGPSVDQLEATWP